MCCLCIFLFHCESYRVGDLFIARGVIEISHNHGPRCKVPCLGRKVGEDEDADLDDTSDLVG